MEGQRRVLQDRVQAPPVGGCRIETQKRVRGQRHEQQKRQRNRGLHRKHIGLERCRKVIAKHGNGGAKHRQDQHPQQHRAFMIAPHTGDFIDQRLGRMRVGFDVGNRKIRRDIGVHQGQKSDEDQNQLRHRRRFANSHETRVTHLRAIERHNSLHRCHQQRQNQGKMSEFGNHLVLPFTVSWSRRDARWSRV